MRIFKDLGLGKSGHNINMLPFTPDNSACTVMRGALLCGVNG